MALEVLLGKLNQTFENVTLSDPYPILAFPCPILA
jgi:hypothetical protein